MPLATGEFQGTPAAALKAVCKQVCEMGSSRNTTTVQCEIIVAGGFSRTGIHSVLYVSPHGHHENDAASWPNLPGDSPLVNRWRKIRVRLDPR